MIRHWSIAVVSLPLLVGVAGAAEDSAAITSATPAAKIDKAAGFAFFESNIRPVLVKHCYECHSDESGEAEGGLRVDDRLSIRSGGGRGVAIVPSRPEASLLLMAISHSNPDLKMPPKEYRLSDEVIHDFKQWIMMGAPDPRDAEKSNASSVWSGVEAARDHWAYQAPHRSAPPEVNGSDWPRSDIDSFVLARLSENHLTPTADAEPQVLLRRLYFDLVGLPPSPADSDRFLNACTSMGVDDALAAEVDDQLASPRFGERWGRHWLDIARFGESSGKEENISFPYAWRYRDYVIDSVNADVPIDRFITEQIAGDLLPDESDRERSRLLVATGFLAIGTKTLGANDKQFQADTIDEQIDTVSRALLGSSVACARCHHHKFDPFAMEDYYALAGIFASTKTYFGTFVSPSNRQSGDPLVLPRLEDDVILHESIPIKRLRKMQSDLAELRAERKEMDAALFAALSGKKPVKTFTLREVLRNAWRMGPIEGKLETVDESGESLPLAMGTLDANQIVDAPLLARGEVNRPGKSVPRGFPRAIDVGDTLSVPKNQSGRLQLAQWLTTTEQPLTSRVFVNRVWHHLFGSGLVATVDNFGTTGEQPSHPELLDTLAVQFVERGWSLKQLIRQLVLSRTYRQASTYKADAFLHDPDNRLLWRMPKRRLEAEAIRDAMLVVSGELDCSRPDGSLVATVIGDRPISLIGLDKNLPTDLDGSAHRSVYLPVIRDRLPDVLELFDFAEPSLVTGVRDSTNVPVQALYLMNSPFVQQRSAELASRLIRELESEEARIRLAFQLCFNREPDSNELQRATMFLQQIPVDVDTASKSSLLESFCQALLSTAEFRNID